MIICPICNKEMKCINNSHLKIHKLNMKMFKSLYPNYETETEEVKKKNIENRKKGVIARIASVKLQAKERLERKKEEFKLLNKCCKECDKPLLYNSEVSTNFCNHSCAAKYNNKNRIVLFTQEGKQKQRLNGFKMLENFVEYQKIRAKAQVFNKVCEICKNNFEVGVAKKLNKTCSLECKKLLHSQVNHRENNTYGKSGYYQGIYCASSWELAFLIYNKDLGNDIKRCDLTFNYVMKEIQHTYFPDFIMDNIIYEVKGRELEDVEFKTQAVINKGYKIEVVRKKEITPIIKAIKQKYNVKDITTLYDEKV